MPSFICALHLKDDAIAKANAVFEKHGNGKSATGGVVADNAGGKLILAAPRNSRRMGDYVLLL